ncbi:hypothetical protein BJY04DRAFT_195778 [Aspergillus karnatakaensis]|uniref:uncharacterized protein n=1 Tax=Aspergillus karnatakaensis TaxID=1810916 RepID=UPI003CCDA577
MWVTSRMQEPFRETRFSSKKTQDVILDFWGTLEYVWLAFALVIIGHGSFPSARVWISHMAPSCLACGSILQDLADTAI